MAHAALIVHHVAKVFRDVSILLLNKKRQEHFGSLFLTGIGEIQFICMNR